jgi:hypothetical protein
MSTLVAIDPSTTCTGIAVFDNEFLLHTRAAHRPLYGSDNPGARISAMVDQVRRLIPRPGWQNAVTDVVYERPQVYRASKSKGDPNDLLAIPAIGAAVAEWYVTDASNPKVAILSYTPREWAGTLPKETDGKLLKRDLFTNPRALRIRERLRDNELRVFECIETYDELDAIGIGLHHLGRGITKRHRALKGAT